MVARNVSLNTLIEDGENVIEMYNLLEDTYRRMIEAASQKEFSGFSPRDKLLIEFDHLSELHPELRKVERGLGELEKRGNKAAGYVFREFTKRREAYERRYRKFCRTVDIATAREANLF